MARLYEQFYSGSYFDAIPLQNLNTLKPFVSSSGSQDADRSAEMDDIRLSLTAGVTLDADANPVVFHSPGPPLLAGSGGNEQPRRAQGRFPPSGGAGSHGGGAASSRERDRRPPRAVPAVGVLARPGASQRALLARTLVRDGMPLATLQPISPFFEYREDAASPGAAYRLSRFAFTRRDGDEFLLEAAAGHAYLRLHAPPPMPPSMPWRSRGTRPGWRRRCRT